jgi:hypothetical protein
VALQSETKLALSGSDTRGLNASFGLKSHQWLLRIRAAQFGDGEFSPNVQKEIIPVSPLHL